MMNRLDEARLKQTDAFLSFLRYARGQIDCYALCAPELFSRCDPKLLLDCGLPKEQTPTSFEEMMRLCPRTDGISWDWMRQFADDFGKQYRKEQVEECDRYIEMLESRRKLLASELPNKRKLRMTLCLTGTAMAVIVLL